MAKTPAKKPAGSADKGLKIVARKDSFRRCGRVFGAEPTVISLSDLTIEEVEQLQAEPQLVVVECDIPVEADAA
jgi:Mu-like prophage FluMu N-terminal domain